MIDLRSDTLTLPNKEMLETILTAKLGDDGRVDANGRGEDLSVNALEDYAARLLGKEAALLFPTGTFGNTAAIMTRCAAQDPVLVHEQQHLLLTEKLLFEESYSRLRPIRYRMNENMTPDVEMIDRLLGETGAKMLCLENTHNFSGGYCIPVAEMEKLRAVADRHGAHIHLDGARLFHAAAALGVPAAALVKDADSVMFCISKGLGAPVGSLLCGTREHMQKARDLRRLMGGGMRQAGVIAAPGLYALEHNIERMTEDIANAKLVAALVKDKLHKLVIQDDVQSNIVVFRLTDTAVTPAALCTLAEQAGLLIRPVLSDSVRLVFYKGITAEDARGAAEILIALDQKL